MKYVRSPFALAIIFLINSTQPIAFAQNLDGFSSARTTEQRRIEEQFRTVPQPASAREHLRRLTAEPHIAGSREDYTTAVYVRDQMRSFGLRKHAHSFSLSDIFLCDV